MVDIDVPNATPLSPYLATPHLIINHDVAADLDSSNTFEGPEKLLEVWFAPSAKELPSSAAENGLKAVVPAIWEGMLDLVNCKVLSIVNSEHVDAYLLSESSMFVFAHKLILKTCGTTTLLLGLRRLLQIAAVDAGFPFHNVKSVDDVEVAATPYRVFYSRKNFLFPDFQRGPHRSWKQEVGYLDEMFEDGSAYMVGKMNGDHWYLYMTSPTAALTPPRTPPDDGLASSTVKRSARSRKISTGICPSSAVGNEYNQDETLEILMTDLEPTNAKQFYLSHASQIANKLVPGEMQDARRLAHESLGVLSGAAQGTACEPQAVTLGNTGKPDPVGSLGSVSAADAAAQIIVESLTTEGHALGTVVSDHCGLSGIYPTSTYPDARIDAYMFSPCGFSANGVIPAPSAMADSVKLEGRPGSLSWHGEGHYFTVHVTPEPTCSFASFETNVPSGASASRQTSDIIEQVVTIFRPGRFSVTLFEARGQSTPRPKTSPTENSSTGEEVRRGPWDLNRQRRERVPGYRRIDRIVHEFEDYDLIFRYYEQDGWTGDRKARIGEELA